MGKQSRRKRGGRNSRRNRGSRPEAPERGSEARPGAPPARSAASEPAPAQAAAAGAPAGPAWPELALLAVLVTLPYLPFLSNGFVYDDLVLIVAKAAPASLSDAFSVFTELHHPSGLQYYRPLSALTLSVQQMIWGAEPLPYHLFNVMLLVLAAFIVRGLFRSVPHTGDSRTFIPTAFAALFALHPLVSSSVHAISGRETLLAVIFMAGATWAFVRGGHRWLALSLLVAALLCKEQALALPLVFVLADWLGVSRDSPRRAVRKPWSSPASVWVQRYAMVLLIVVGYFVVRSQVFGGETGSRAKPLELALLDDPAGPLLSLVYSLQTIFVPTADLHYEPHLVAWWSSWRFLLTVGGAVGLAYLTVTWGKPCKQALSFWAGWAAVTLLPSANVLAQETLFAERYVVFPFLGVAGFGATLAAEIWAHRSRAWVAGALAVSLVGTGFLSYHRGRFFADHYTFLTQWAQSDPSSHQARASLAEYHRQREEWEQALPLEREALDLLHDALPEPLCIKRHFALAGVLAKLGRYDEAAAEYEEILRMKPQYSGARRLLERARSLSRASGPGRNREGGLSWEGRERLLEGLMAPELAGSPVWFAVTTTDPRSEQMQVELEDVFRQAGWQVRGTEVVDFSMKPGLFIFAADPEAPWYVDRLNQVLGQSGLPVTAFATDYRSYSREAAEKNPDWSGFHLAPDQTYVLAIGRPGS